MRHSEISALILAAGLSSRMGSPKPLLPFCGASVIERILAALSNSDLGETLVVVGHARAELETHLAGQRARTVYNPDYARGEMLSSLQAGLRAMPPWVNAALITLGDQPAIEPEVVDQVITAYRLGLGSIIIPSYQMRRGHPHLIDRRHWDDILTLGEGETLRDFMRRSNAAIYHVNVTTPSILRDMDTPADYQRELVEYTARHGQRERDYGA